MLDQDSRIGQLLNKSFASLQGLSRQDRVDLLSLLPPEDNDDNHGLICGW